jgi:hypothetical protein
VAADLRLADQPGIDRSPKLSPIVSKAAMPPAPLRIALRSEARRGIAKHTVIGFNAGFFSWVAILIGRPSPIKLKPLI